MADSTRYTDLVYKLYDLLQGPLASIEILPGGLEEWELIEGPPGAPKTCLDFPFVFIEGNLGIPKKIMYALYMAATAIPWHSSSPHEASAASIVILLLNPAHHTALNSRKRLIEDGHLDPEKELILTELICRGSPECAKQSIIWDHRRWCFRKIHGVMGPGASAPSLQHWGSSEEMQLFPKISPTVIQHELNIIQHACETYPRNYHAWAHWHFIINVSYASIQLSDDDLVQRDFLSVIVEENRRLRSWVDLHVSDYSAMHQLCQSQMLIGHLSSTGLFKDDIAKDLPASALVDHAVSLLVAFPSHESLWMYLRTSLEHSSLETRSKVFERMESQIPATSSDYSEQMHQLLTWFRREQRKATQH